jgi:hypothetical protein
MTTIALILAAVLIFALGITLGLWLAGQLNHAPILPDDYDARRGAEWADGVRK